MKMGGLAQEVRERPILFSGPMVRAILEGRKTQTRRVVRPQPPAGCVYAINGNHDKAVCHTEGPVDAKTLFVPPTPRSKDHLLPCPYGKPGDRLWVRETWRERGSAQREDGKLGVGPSFYRSALYRADGHEYDGPWRPSIFMPRPASRITLEITGVRVERLRKISREDVVAEGVGADWWPTSNLCAQWEKGWDAINGKRPGCAWKDNPWVWVLNFKRVRSAPLPLERT